MKLLYPEIIPCAMCQRVPLCTVEFLPRVVRETRSCCEANSDVSYSTYRRYFGRTAKFYGTVLYGFACVVGVLFAANIFCQ